MQLAKLISTLTNIVSVIIPFKNESINITNFKLLKKDETQFISECIYIGTTSDLPQIPLSINSAFICIEDINLSDMDKETGQLNICVIETPLNKYEVLTYISEAMNEEFKLISNMQKLLNVVYSNQGLQILIDTAKEVSGHTMLVLDTSFKIMASSYDAKDLVGIHEDTNLGQYLDESIIDFIRNNNIMSKIRSKGKSHYVKKLNPYNGTLAILIHIEDIEVGQLVVFEGGKKFKESDFEFMESFSKLLSVELQKTNLFNINKDLISNYILTDLIEKNYISEDIINKRFQYLNLIKSRAFYIMVITNNKLGSFDSKIPFIIQSLKALIPTNNCIVYKSSLVVFVDDSLTYNLFDESSSEFIEYLKINSLSAGISIRFTSLSVSRKYYLQALKANEFALRYKLLTLHYDKCIKYMFAEFISSQSEIKDFCHPAVINLAKEDIENNTNFLKTLKYYIYFTHSPNDAAKALCIHRNTLFYRINRIKQLTNITLDNAEEIFHIYYSIELIEFNNSTFPEEKQ